MSKLTKIDDPHKMAGCYSLYVYCDTNNPEHEFREFPHEFTAESGSTCRAKARRIGWKLRKDGTATCPKCNKQ